MSSQMICAIISVKTDPEQLPRLLDLISSTQRGAQASQGFLSSRIHKSLDNTRVLVYQQWSSREDYDAFLASDERKTSLAEVKNFIDAGHASDIDWSLFEATEQLTS